MDYKSAVLRHERTKLIIQPSNMGHSYIMLSQVSNKDMISAAYESGVEFFIQKPINAIEVESVLTKVSQSIAMKRTLSMRWTLFMLVLWALILIIF